MMLNEANDRLKKAKINEEQLWGLNSLYILLDLHKDEFCKIVDLVGVETLLNKQAHYDRLRQAEEELNAKERFLQAQRKLKDMETEKARLEEIVAGYKPY